MPSLVAKLPSPVFAQTVLPGAITYGETGAGYDFAIGGMPFQGAASEQRPVVRQTAPTQKEQTDTSREPGEHSMAFWWLKAQSSFHGGAGQRYLGSADTGNDDISRYRYWESEGVDVFGEAGSVSLLPRTTRLNGTTGIATPMLAMSGSSLYVASGATLTRFIIAPLGGQPDHPSSSMNLTDAAVAWGGGEQIRSITAGNGFYFLLTDTGVYRGSGTGAATKVYQYPEVNYTPGVGALLRFVKQRLILANFEGVYELDATKTSAAVGGNMPAALFDAYATFWNAMTETPAGILLAAESGNRSVVYNVALDTSGPVPVLAPGVVAAEFPPGEFVRGMASYLGTVIGVQTTAGFRVGVLDDSGGFQYGALLFKHTWGQATGAVFGHGNSLYAGWTNPKGVAGLARVDLSATIGSGQSLRFPWAPDMRASTLVSSVQTYAGGTASEAALWDYNRKVVAVPNQGVYVEWHDKEPSGYLTTSRIRWDTLEPKMVRFARIRGEGVGTLQLELARDSDVSFYTVGSIDVGTQPDSGDMQVFLQNGQFFSARLTLAGASPTFQGYQLKGLPTQRRQRFISLPLYCFDRETDNTGQIVGYDGSAMKRILQLESLEQSGQVAALQWLNSQPDQQLTEYVTIEQIEFQQQSGPSDSRGWGGIVTLTLRTVS